MRILALNCGSSSIKSAVMDMPAGARVREVRIENIGTPECRLRIGNEASPLAATLTQPQAVSRVLNEQLRSGARIDAVAHRVVHGGAQFVQPVLLDNDVIRELQALNALAPLHNPPAVAAIEEARRTLPQVPQVAVFDTAFHSTLPPRSRDYALPRELAQRLQLRRYGFHGISHAHVMQAVSAALHAEPQSLRIISCHLGNGASVTAIEYGRSIDTSMGMTPLEGLVMGTRAGSVDPGILLRLLDEGFDARRLEVLLNRESGLEGLTGTEDMQVIEQRAAAGDEACRLAITLFAHRVRHYIGAYAAVMGGIDAIAFTGGIGEHSSLIRHRVLQRLEFLGAVLDEDRNRDVTSVDAAAPVDISDATSRTRLLVVSADEERMLAQEASRLLAASARPTETWQIPIAVSARHAHLSQATLDQLFGAGHVLRVNQPLSQPGQFSAEETVSLIGPRGRIDDVRLMGPPRAIDQIEISRSDEFRLGVDAPVRLSGDIQNSPGITLEGPQGRVTLRSGVICARRHIHMSLDDASRMGVQDHQTVAVRINSDGRDLVFGDVVVRTAADFRLEMHLDTDEANAAGVCQGDTGELVMDA